MILQRYNVSDGTVSVIDTIKPIHLNEKVKKSLRERFKKSWVSHLGSCDFGCEKKEWPYE